MKPLATVHFLGKLVQTIQARLSHEELDSFINANCQRVVTEIRLSNGEVTQRTTWKCGRCHHSMVNRPDLARHIEARPDT